MKKLRWIVRENETSPDGRRAFSVGLRGGYWPCEEGPFAQLTFGFRRITVWYGRDEAKPSSIEYRKFLQELADDLEEEAEQMESVSRANGEWAPPPTVDDQRKTAGRIKQFLGEGE